MNVEKGVALALAEHRAETISNLSYEIKFSIPEAIEQSITGHVKLAFELSDVSEGLVIDFNESPDKTLSVRSASEPVEFEIENGHIIILASSLKTGGNEIEIDFIAGESSLNRNKEFLYTLFVPDRASFAFPCFDQPNLKASYSLTLEIPESWQAVANGGLENATTENGQTICTFAPTKSISTYLFSFAAGAFKIVEGERDGRKMRFYHRETDSEKVAKNTEAIFDLHAAALAWLEDYTGVPYPFEKFDFALIPSFQYGGMEHPGAIVYRASSLFLEKSATPNQLLGRASLIAHETAHMWFGDLVTMDWFNDVWMKEVFANFMAAKIVNPSFPEINHELRFFLAHHPRAYNVDRTEGANPIRQPLENLKNAGSLYGAIIYQKAPVVMQQLERMIGETEFRDGIREYLKRYSFGNATWLDLVEILDARSDEDLKAWSQVWVGEPGRPIIETAPKFNADGDLSEILFSQKDELDGTRIWPQKLNVALLNGEDESADFFPLTFAAETLSHKFDRPLPAPEAILANGDGAAYGNFILDEKSRKYLITNAQISGDPLLRGVAWVTLWDEMLNGAVPAKTFLAAASNSLAVESDPLVAQRILNYIQTAFWKFLNGSDRESIALNLEETLWRLIETPVSPKLQTAYFRAFRSVAMSNTAVDKLRRLWRKELTVPGLVIQENDMTTLSLELAVRSETGGEDILREQLARIENPDRRERIQFIMPALSADQSVRNDFFDSLQKAENRSHEPWVLTALNYLHHPLRVSASVKYLKKSLELLEEIQQTGDIFFPKRWLDATFGGHNSPEAAKIVSDFLDGRPNYPHRLRGKILQSTDLLFRASAALALD